MERVEDVQRDGEQFEPHEDHDQAVGLGERHGPDGGPEQQAVELAVAGLGALEVRVGHDGDQKKRRQDVGVHEAGQRVDGQGSGPHRAGQWPRPPERQRSGGGKAGEDAEARAETRGKGIGQYDDGAGKNQHQLRKDRGEIARVHAQPPMSRRTAVSDSERKVPGWTPIQTMRMPSGANASASCQVRSARVRFSGCEIAFQKTRWMSESM